MIFHFERAVIYLKRIDRETNLIRGVTMKSIKQILMERDDMTEAEAENLIAEVKEEIQIASSCGDYELVEDIMYGDLGLEMDYIFELLF